MAGDTNTVTRERSRQLALMAVATGVAYYAAARVGLALTPSSQALSTLWPPNAVLLGALLLAPLEWWLALILATIGYPLQRAYLRDRFGPRSGLPGQQMNAAYVWARNVQNARVGVVGTTAGFYHYGLYGTDLSNRVTYLGDRGPRGAFNPIPDCVAFREAVNDANLDYLVTSPFLNFVRSSEPIVSPEARWLRGSTAIESIQSEGDVTVWRVRGTLDPATCGAENAPLREVPQQPEM